jgi:nucleotide-binding universal stress UspA family protein
MKNYEINNILVPVDFTGTSEVAVTEAVAIAGPLNAGVSLIHVLETSQYHYSIEPEMQSTLPSIGELEAAVEKKMDKLCARITRNSGIRPSVKIVTGDVHSEIIKFLGEKDFGLIIMGTHGASGYRELFIGSNAQRVVTLSDIPVLTLQKKSSIRGHKNILIPIDNSLHSREKINIAVVIAEIFGAKIHLIGLPDSDEPADLHKLKIKLESVEKHLTANRLQYKTTMVTGESLASAALNYADKHRCDLIVINTGHESEVTGIFLGAFAQQIVNHSNVPVLSFKHSEDHYTIDTPGFGIG